MAEESAEKSYVKIVVALISAVALIVAGYLTYLANRGDSTKSAVPPTQSNSSDRGKEPTSSTCPALAEVQTPIQTAAGVGLPTGLPGLCLSDYMQIGRHGIAQWFLHSKNVTTSSVGPVTLHVDVPSYLAVVEGSVQYFPSNSNDVQESTSVLDNGLTVTFPSQSQMWFSFLTEPNPTQIPVCTERTIAVTIYWTGAQESQGETSPSVHVTDPYC
jgi:hypothetical protein